MADNYLEKRMEELRQVPRRMVFSSQSNLDSLLVRNRSTRGYDKSYIVHRRQLDAIVSVADKVPTARNQQVLRFRLVLGDEARKILPLIGMGRALEHLHLPFPGTEPGAFIVFCTSHPQAPHFAFDEGIMAQSMLLKAVEIGLNGLIIKNFPSDKMTEALELGTDSDGIPYRATTVLAIGKTIERPALIHIHSGDDVNYWRDDDGKHIVPKIFPEELVISLPEDSSKESDHQ